MEHNWHKHPRKRSPENDGKASPFFPPNAVEAEEGLIASILLDPDKLNTALEIVGTEDFYLPHTQNLFDAMRRLANVGIGLDTITLRDEMRSVGHEISPEDLTRLFNMEPTPRHVTHYAQIVRRTSTSRKLIRYANTWRRRAEEGEPPADLLPEIEFELTELMGNNDHRMGVRATAATLEEIIGEAERGELAGWSTGLKRFDDISGGFYAGDFVIVAGATSIGKSILALNFLEHFAFSGRRGAYFSIEMPLKQLVKRALSSRSGVSLAEVRRKGINENWLRMLVDTAKVLGPVLEDTLELWDVSHFTPAKFRVMCKAAKARGGLSIACVDFLQLMQPDEVLDIKEREMANIAQSLKAVAREMGIVVIGVSQLNLQWAHNNRRPTKEDLKYSSAIEQAADTVMLLYVDKPEKGKYSASNLKLIVDKQRNDATGEYSLRHREGEFRFEET